EIDGTVTALSPATLVREVGYGSRSEVLWTVTDPNGRALIERHVYDNLIRSTADYIGKTNDVAGTREFDSMGHVLSERALSDGNPLTAGTNPHLAVTQYSYDVYGRLQSVTDPIGGLAQLTYNALGLVATTLDPNGRVVAFDYDSA